jgi:hypothetical protein
MLVSGECDVMITASDVMPTDRTPTPHADGRTDGRSLISKEYDTNPLDCAQCMPGVDR